MEAQGSVGKGMTPYAHPDWTFYALPSIAFYDYYGAVRATPPTIGATEPFASTRIVPPPARDTHSSSPFDVRVIASRRSTRMTLELWDALPLVDLIVNDMQGRHVRTLYYGPLGRGRQEFFFDSRGHDGKRMMPGWYTVRTSLGRDVVSKEFQLLD